MDYMKGYNNRNRRRRSLRRRSGRSMGDITHVGYYMGKSKYKEHSRIDARMIIVMAIIAVILSLLIVCVAILFNRKSSASPSQDDQRVVRDVSGGAAEVVTGASLENGMESNGVAVEVAAVATLAPGMIPTPAPTPRPKAVALTFDDGPRGDSSKTPKVLDLLKKYNAHATFFVVGSYVSANADVLKREVEQGCEIGNHSWDHTNLAGLSMKKVNKQYDRTAKLVKKLVGYDIKLLRPPYGAISDKMRKSLKHPMVLWNVDTLDWKTKDPKKILKQVKKTVKDGDIILMHDIHPTTADSLEKVLPWLVKNGYDILTVTELAKRKGAPLNNGKAYGGFYGS